jgi:hypothetical protein
MQEDKRFEADKLGYQLTRTQQDAFKALVAAADEMMDRMEEVGRAGSQESLASPERSASLERLASLERSAS